MARFLVSSALALILAMAASAQSFVVPAFAAGSEGSSVIIYVTPGTFQCVYSAAFMSGIPAGTQLAGISFRQDGGEPLHALTSYSDFDLYLGPSNFAPGSLSASAAANQGAGTVLVRSGAISFPAGSYPGGNSPNGFGPLIPFSTPFTYAGGPLLLTVAYDNSANPMFWDAVSGQAANMQSRFGMPYNTDTLGDDIPGYGPVIQLHAVPEPASVVLLAVAGAAALGGWSWRRRRQALAQTDAESSEEGTAP